MDFAERGISLSPIPVDSFDGDFVGVTDTSSDKTLTRKVIDATRMIFSQVPVPVPVPEQQHTNINIKDGSKRKAEFDAAEKAHESLKRLCRQISSGLEYDIEPDMEMKTHLFRRHSTIQLLKNLETDAKSELNSLSPSLCRSHSLVSVGRKDSTITKAFDTLLDFNEIEDTLKSFDDAVNEIVKNPSAIAITNKDEDFIDMLINSNNQHVKENETGETTSDEKALVSSESNPRKLERKTSWLESTSGTSWRVF
mmetsp:Transcript_12311/g.15996  ORF Transcript_12311/g.15996 Transcript_12311/m.15996 type:complete len:253 (+) Transcript_12311:285-1043(+)